MPDEFQADIQDSNQDGRPDNVKITAKGKSLKWFYIALIIVTATLAIAYTLTKILG